MARVKGNLDALRREIENSDFDAVVAMSPENAPYASGVLLWTQRSIRDRLALVVLPKKGSPTLIVATQEEGYCREKSWIEGLAALTVTEWTNDDRLLGDIGGGHSSRMAQRWIEDLGSKMENLHNFRVHCPSFNFIVILFRKMIMK